MNPLVNRVEGVKRSLRQLAGAHATWAVVIILLAIQLAVEWGGGYRSLPWWFEIFGLTRSGQKHGELWQLVSYALLHGNWLHVLVNCACLLMLGGKLEHALGSGVVLRAMLWGALGGAAVHLLLASPDRPGSMLVGSSGAVYGLLILSITLAPESQLWPFRLSGRALGMMLLTTSLLLALIDPMLDLPGFSRAGRWLSANGFGNWWAIGHACHFGGGVAGWGYGRWLLRPRITLERLRRQRARRERQPSSTES